MERKISYIASNGKTKIEFAVGRYLDRPIIYAKVDGKSEYNSGSINTTRSKDWPASAVAAVGRICFSQETFEQLSKMVADVQSEIDADPSAKMNKLIAQREQLQREIGYVFDAQHEDHYSRIERASATGIYKEAKRDYAAEEKVAREKLAEFDAANPVVLAEVQKRKNADMQRFLEAN